MKNSISTITLLAATLLAAPVASVLAVETNPVGFITLTLNGTGGVGTSAVSIIGVPLENAVESMGTITDTGGTTLTSGDSSWTPSDFAGGSHYLRLVSGANSGVIATITANTATTLTTAEDISSLVSIGDQVEIRAYTTLADVFGADNQAGIGTGENADAADEILIFNGTNYDIYYYQEGAAFGGTGFRSSVNAFSDASVAVVPPGVAIVYKRKANDPLDVVVAGSVLSSDTFIPIENGVNIVSGAHPIELTLESYFGADGGSLQKGATANDADEILVFNGTNYDIYYYQEGAAFGGTGYRSSVNAFSNAASTVIADAGTGFLLKRKSGAYNQIDDTPVDDL